MSDLKFFGCMGFIFVLLISFCAGMLVAMLFF